MKERPQQTRLNTITTDDDFFQEHSSDTFEHKQDEIEQAIEDMQQIEDEIAFFQDALEEIKSLVEYHVLPIAEHLTTDDLKQFVQHVYSTS